MDRYIAPEDFIKQLIERCYDRIVWGHKVDRKEMCKDSGETIISTLPMSLVWQWLNSSAPNDLPACPVDFSYKPIHIRRFRIPGADVFQTIYFPMPETNLYRASITGDILIAEYIEDGDGYDFFPAFGLNSHDCEEQATANKQFGKIKTINIFLISLLHLFLTYDLNRLCKTGG